MKRCFCAVIAATLSFSAATPAHGQGETAVAFLAFPSSPEANGMGGISSAVVSAHPMAILGNPAQLGFLAGNGFLNAGVYMPASNPYRGLSEASYSVLALNGGMSLESQIGLPLSIGIGYTHVANDLGEFMVTSSTGPEVIGTFHSYEYSNNISLGVGFDSWVRFGAGASIKFVHSELSAIGSESEQGNGRASITAYDIGALLVIPLAEIASKAGAPLAVRSINVEPLVDLTFGLAKSNIGDKITYVDAAQADPLPRQATLGAGLELGIVSTAVPGKWKLFTFTLVREASDLLVRRHSDGSSEYVPGAGDVNFFDNVLAASPEGHLTQRKGWQVDLAEFFQVRGGSTIEPDPYSSFTTTGFGVRLGGLMKALYAMGREEEGSWITFFRETLDLRYDYSSLKTRYYSDPVTYGAISLTFRKILF